MDMRIPFEISTKCVKNTYESGSEFHGHVIFMKHTQNYTSNGRKKIIKQRTISKKEFTKISINGKDTMTMRCINEIQRHFGSTFG